MTSIGRRLCSRCVKLTKSAFTSSNQIPVFGYQGKPLNVAIGNGKQLTSMFHTSSASAKDSVHLPDATVKGGDGPDRYEPNSPYRQHWPQRQQFREGEIYTGGLLPRLDKKIESIHVAEYKQADNWTEEKALFGQNDYIDILGDWNIHPVDLVCGPPWLRGFSGNEYQRLTREMIMDGEMLQKLYPSEYKLKEKRLKFLYRKYNIKRGKRIGK